MRRFRFTLITVCLVLLYLGGNDLLLWFQNQEPAPLSVKNLQEQGSPREWLHISDGYQDLDRAISTSGTIEMEALLVPLLEYPQQETIRILVETRQPQLLDLFKQYHLFTDTVPEKRAFRQEHSEEFQGQRDIIGMEVSGLIAKNNHNKLLKLALQTDLKIAEDVIFISESKEPGKWRGISFCIIGLLGLAKALTGSRKKTQDTPLSKEK